MSDWQNERIIWLSSSVDQIFLIIFISFTSFCSITSICFFRVALKIQLCNIQYATHLHTSVKDNRRVQKLIDTAYTICYVHQINYQRHKNRRMTFVHDERSIKERETGESVKWLFFVFFFFFFVIINTQASSIKRSRLARDPRHFFCF